MSTTTVLLDERVADEAPARARLKDWAAIGRPELRRAGLLRGAACTPRRPYCLPLC
ncbi:hypothetical protein OG948_36150 (plasmid) [Embleya sp. NBC_00888]|uniref:hypothetical protein n=1 Tax=Embleya sp. NBC_00888 TaxID=2975960 RepID=UPI002F9116CC|nr:hypothetical protein OG948_36150 [Embleya sp. NBC_00888]